METMAKGIVQSLDEVPERKLPNHFLNPGQVLCHQLPKLRTGVIGVQTVSKAPTIHKWFEGDLAIWDNFSRGVLDLYKDPRTVEDMKRCAHDAITINPAIQKVHKHVMTYESILTDCETTLSGRFFQNALYPVINAVQAIASARGNSSENEHWLPAGLEYGGSWIINKPERVQDLSPDVVMKLQIKGFDRVRMVGELKFHTTVDLRMMVEEARKNKTKKLEAILSQIVDYMLSYRTKYGFISNYEGTTFLLLDEHSDANGFVQPRLYFSPIVKHDTNTDVAKSTISLKMALFYVVSQTYSERDEDWKISDAIAELKNSWIVDRQPLPRSLLPARSTSSVLSTPLRPAPFKTSPNLRFPSSPAFNAFKAAPRFPYRNALLHDDNGTLRPSFMTDTPTKAPAIQYNGSGVSESSPLAAAINGAVKEPQADDFVEDSVSALASGVSKLDLHKKH